MVSVENFYWILYHNLLRGAELDCWYFLPFGTCDRLSQWEWGPKADLRFPHHALFQFDQEPIYAVNDVYGKVDLPFSWCWSTKLCRLLVNSERSLIKKQACTHYGMLDWYFFYHGFAALDWFHDSRFIDLQRPWTKVFCSYNHMVQHKRSYRMFLTARLIEKGLVTHGDISFHGTPEQMQDELMDVHSYLTAKQKDTVARYLVSADLTALKVDHQTIDGTHSAFFGPNEYRFWQRAFFHVVNETVFFDKKLHLTEKIFKPIVSLRPFILVAAEGNLQYLRDYGFRTFATWIDESYDQEPDPARRLDLILAELVKLCYRSHKELQEMYREMLPVLEHNKRHFFGNFREIIVNELVDNFDQCIRIWNNGRVDGRELPVHPNLDSVKQLLLA